MSKQYPGGIISKTPPVPTQSAASGVWTLDQQAYWQKLGQWPAPPNLISRSLRFNSADSAYLNRTPASAGNRRTFTVSLWMKQSVVSGVNDFFGTTTAFLRIRSDADGKQLQFYDPSVGGLNSNNVLRDPSAWYHFVMAVDTTQATASNRVILYINGVNSTNTSGSYPSQNYDYSINNASEQLVGKGSSYADGYITEINFIDGQALTPASFGYTDANTGVWTTLRYTGTYGTNGFYLNFSDNSNTTAATLGADYSGNGNNWTPNNFSVTAGAGNDSMVDTPTPYGTDTGVGGSVRGNYSTLNPLDATGASAVNGNLDVTLTSPGSTIAQIRGTIAPTSGKWYWESTITTDGNQSTQFGIVSAATASNISLGSGQSVNQVIYNRYDGTKTVNGTNSAYGSSYTTGDVIGVALDLDGNTITFYKNNTSQGSISLPTTGIAYTPVYWWSSSTSAGAATYNFGQRAFAYTAPSGYKALCTQNLPTPTIGATSATLANKYFDINLWTGNGTSQTLTNSGGFQPDWVWTKGRSNADSNVVVNAVTGANQFLVTESTQAEATSSALVSAFTSSGFSIGSSTSINRSSSTYVGWQWKANGSGSSNTAGSITSTVSASTTSGFSIATYTGNGTSGATVGHGLGATPSMIFVKARSAGIYDWRVYHISLTAGYFIPLNNTDAQTQGSTNDRGYIGSVSSSTFTLTTGVINSDGVNGSGVTYVAYSFAPIAGYSAFGKYTGNGSADGPFVFTGFRPAFVMMRRIDSTSNWGILDSSRNLYNLTNNTLYPNGSFAEDTLTQADLLSNGFKLRGTGNTSNTSGGTYIYMALASNPFKYSLAR